MKTKVLFIGLLFGVLALALVVLFVSDDEVIENNAVLPSEVTESEYQGESQVGVGSLQALIQRGDTLECTVSYRNDENSNPVEGTFFTRNGQVRGDFVQNDPDLGEVVSSLILKADEVYVWSEIDGDTFGVVAPIERQAEANLPVELDATVRFNCIEWTRIDDSIFQLPSQVLFQDLNELNAEYGTIYEEGEFPF